MKLVDATDEHLRHMMAWFTDCHDCVIWGGPAFRFPFTEASFLADTHRSTLPSYVLVEDDGELLGFGQYYLRAGRCHLSRLLIAPNHRGRGLGAELIRRVVAKGVTRLRVAECSLFVYASNRSALRLYERLGFVRGPYPEAGGEFAGSHYMTAASGSLGYEAPQ